MNAARRAWERLSRSHVRIALGVALGVAGGAAYAHFIGCGTGSCPLTASIWRTATFGAVVGAIAAWPPPRPR